MSLFDRGGVPLASARANIPRQLMLTPIVGAIFFVFGEWTAGMIAMAIVAAIVLVVPLLRRPEVEIFDDRVVLRLAMGTTLVVPHDVDIALSAGRGRWGGFIGVAGWGPQPRRQIVGPFVRPSVVLAAILRARAGGAGAALDTALEELAARSSELRLPRSAGPR